jgi:hypothetical protein
VKRSLIVASFAVCACNSSAVSDGSSSQSESKTEMLDAELALTPLELTAKATLDTREREREAKAALQRQVTPAMEAYLLDPFSAEYRELRAGRNGAVCGQVNAKNRLGAYVGFRTFVVGQDRKSVYMSEYSDGVTSELYGSFAQAYLNACATRAETERHALATKPYDDDWHTEGADSYQSTPNDEPASEAELEDPFEGL